MKCLSVSKPEWEILFVSQAFTQAESGWLAMNIDIKCGGKCGAFDRNSTQV